MSDECEKPQDEQIEEGREELDAMREMGPFKEECFIARKTAETLKAHVKCLMRHKEFRTRPREADNPLDASGEMAANLKLAYRHLEDARMRLGKAVQASDGGTSCYPR